MNYHTLKALNKIKNASLLNKESVFLTYNSYILDILKSLYKEGFIQSYTILRNAVGTEDKILIYLRSFYNKIILNKLIFISVPSNKKYLSAAKINHLPAKKNIYFFSTNFGVLTHLECKRKNTGGILLFLC
jgi:small subunit ribosomal protein S8